jgi:hypothetical protein
MLSVNTGVQSCQFFNTGTPRDFRQVRLDSMVLLTLV